MAKKIGIGLLILVGIIYAIKNPGETVDGGKYLINQLVIFVDEL